MRGPPPPFPLHAALSLLFFPFSPNLTIFLLPRVPHSPGEESRESGQSSSKRLRATQGASSYSLPTPNST